MSLKKNLLKKTGEDEMKVDVMVKNIEKETIDGESVVDEHVQTMKCSGSLGTRTVVIKQSEPFHGYKAGQWITVELDNPQTTLEESSNPDDEIKEAVKNLKGLGLEKVELKKGKKSKKK